MSSEMGILTEEMEKFGFWSSTSLIETVTFSTATSPDSLPLTISTALMAMSYTPPLDRISGSSLSMGVFVVIKTQVSS